ncbi:MAG: PRD domain-containing protein [Lactobacillus panisapium]
MQVLKVLNNSLILALDWSGNECILMGKGIGYHKAIGCPIQKKEIQKVFVLTDNKKLKEFVQLANNIPDQYLTLVKEIIDFATSQYQIKVRDYLYLSLADHLSFVVKRVKAGKSGPNFNYPDVMVHHPEEYEIGKFALSLIKKRLKIELPKSEATVIGLHFIDAEITSSKSNKNNNVAQLVSNLEKIVKRSIGRPIDTDTIAYTRFLTHLNYFAERVYDHKLFPDENRENLYQDLANKMPLEVKIINHIASFIAQNYHLQITKQEKIYLLIHLHKIVAEEINKE